MSSGSSRICFDDDSVIWDVLDALATKLDGTPAAPDYFSRRRRVLHRVLGYAVAVMLTACASIGRNQGPRFVAFFGCMYYAMMRPSEVAALTQNGCQLPATGWGNLSFADSSTAAGAAFTDDGTVHEHRGLKGRTRGRSTESQQARRPVRRVPIPPELVALLRQHIARFGVGQDGRVFRSENGNVIQPSTWWRVWGRVRAQSLIPEQLETPPPGPGTAWRS